MTDTISYSAAFLAGLLSFLSPCILPLIPAYFTFITGCSMEQLTTAVDREIRKRVFFSTLFYVFGFSLVFILMGASASYVGNAVFEYKDAIRVVGGVLIIVLGIHITGVFRIRALEVEKRIDVKNAPVNVFGAFFVGMAFGAGWSPCVGPLLGSILILAGSRETVLQGMGLLALYSAGLAVPFILISIFINFILVCIRKSCRFISYLNMAAGILLILVGALLLADKLHWVTGLIS